MGVPSDDSGPMILAANREEDLRDERDLYRGLLVKYIQHVRECEGTDYTNVRSSPGHGPEFFSDTEWAELQRLASEVERG